MSATSEPADTPRTHNDPTRTSTTRERFRQRLAGRTEDVRGDVRSEVTGQGTATGGGSAGPAALAGGVTAGIGGLAMLRSLGAFRQWLARLFDGHVTDTPSLQQARRGTHWTASFVRSAYETGLRRARIALRQQGYEIGDRRAAAVITDDRHQRALAGQYERALIDLEDAVENTVQEISRTVADGGYIEADAVNKRELADTINERVRANTGKRIRLVAADEPVRTANQAALTAYQRADVDQVGVEPEASDTPDDEQELDWRTAEDRFVCLECRGLALDGPYLLAEVLAGNPAPPPSPHHGCRCFLWPF